MKNRLVAFSLTFIMILTLTGCNNKMKDPFDSTEKAPENSATYSDSGKYMDFYDCDDTYYYFYQTIDLEVTFYKLNYKQEDAKAEKIVSFTPWIYQKESKVAMISERIAVYEDYIIYYNTQEQTFYKVQKDGQGNSRLFGEINYQVLDRGARIQGGKLIFLSKDRKHLYNMDMAAILNGEMPSEKYEVSQPEADNKSDLYESFLTHGKLYTTVMHQRNNAYAEMSLLLGGEKILPYYWDVMITHQYIFYIQEHPEQDSYAIYRCELDGANPKMLYSFEKEVRYYASFQNYDANSIYFSYMPDLYSDFKVFRMSTDGKKIENLGDEYLPSKAYRMHVIGNWIFYQEGIRVNEKHHTKISKMKKDGSDAQIVLE